LDNKSSFADIIGNKIVTPIFKVCGPVTGS